jgi:hypothetical protein
VRPVTFRQCFALPGRVSKHHVLRRCDPHVPDPGGPAGTSSPPRPASAPHLERRGEGRGSAFAGGGALLEKSIAPTGDLHMVGL